MLRLTSKVSKKLKLSKSKVNYRKDERRSIHRRVRRETRESTAFGSEQDERDYLNSDVSRYYAQNRG
jgi:hypothetical protein